MDANKRPTRNSTMPRVEEEMVDENDSEIGLLSGACRVNESGVLLLPPQGFNFAKRHICPLQLWLKTSCVLKTAHSIGGMLCFLLTNLYFLFFSKKREYLPSTFVFCISQTILFFTPFLEPESPSSCSCSNLATMEFKKNSIGQKIDRIHHLS